MYTAAVVGCGRMGSELADDPLAKGIYAHAEAYVGYPQTKLIAVCDTDPEKLMRCGDRWNVSHRYTDLSSMLGDARPDIVSICTPDETHYEIAKQCLLSGVKALLVEKPLTTEVETALELVELADQENVKLAVNFIRRFDNNIRRVQGSLHGGSFGQVRSVNGYYTGGLIHNGVHWLDLARFLIGEPDWVWGAGLETSPSAYLHFQNGATGCLQYCNIGYTIFEMDIVCTEGRVRIVDSGYSVESYNLQASPHFTGFKSLSPPAISEGLYYPAMDAVDNIVCCLSSGKKLLSSGYDGLKALELATAIQRSAYFGRPICLNQ